MADASPEVEEATRPAKSQRVESVLGSEGKRPRGYNDGYMVITENSLSCHDECVYNCIYIYIVEYIVVAEHKGTIHAKLSFPDLCQTGRCPQSPQRGRWRWSYKGDRHCFCRIVCGERLYYM